MSEIQNLSEAEFNPVALAIGLANEHPANIVEILNERTPVEAAEIIVRLPADRAIDVLDQSGLECPTEIIDALPRDTAVRMLSAMSADRVADIFRHLSEPSREDLLHRLDSETRLLLQRLLAYPEDTAGSIMTTEFVSVPADWTVAQTLAHIRRVERTRETVYAIYVLDPKTKNLVQSVALRRLISGEPDACVLSVAPHRKPVTVAPLTDREDVARLISKYDLLAVPVVSDSGQVLGICTVDDIIDAIVEETTEDVQRFGGMQALSEPYMQISFLEMIRKRGGWLAALFLSEMLTASAMQGFRGELEKAIVLTLFIPLIMSSGGNSGSQATSLIIRALALREVDLRDWWRVAFRELPAGVTLGAMLGVIGILRISLWQKFGLYDYGEHWVLVAATVGAALIGIVTFGSLTGSMLPFILQSIGFDPASASAPFVATLVDVTGLVIYFSVALLILRGTLL
ncbi:MAG: magnesium transporter [Beijerinckiaceae bacterium]